MRKGVFDTDGKKSVAIKLLDGNGVHSWGSSIKSRCESDLRKVMNKERGSFLRILQMNGSPGDPERIAKPRRNKLIGGNS